MDIIKSLSRVDWTVVEELHHIPKGRKGSFQEALRTEYAAYRKAHRELGAGLPARAALAQAVANVGRFDPTFEPQYDAAFFYEGGRMAVTLAADPLSAEIHAMATRGGDGVSRPASQTERTSETVTQTTEVLTEAYAL